MDQVRRLTVGVAFKVHDFSSTPAIAIEPNCLPGRLAKRPIHEAERNDAAALSPPMFFATAAALTQSSIA